MGSVPDVDPGTYLCVRGHKQHWGFFERPLDSFYSCCKNVCKSYFKVSGKNPNTELLISISIQNTVTNIEGRKYLNTTEPGKHTRSLKFLFARTPTNACTLYICRWYFCLISFRPPKLSLLQVEMCGGVTLLSYMKGSYTSAWMSSSYKKQWLFCLVLVKGQDLYNKVLCSFPCYGGIAGTLLCVIIGSQILTSLVNVQIL